MGAGLFLMAGMLAMSAGRMVLDTLNTSQAGSD